MLSQSTGTLSLTVSKLCQLFFKRVTIHVPFKTLGLNGYLSCCDICCVVMLVWYGKIYCENKENNNSNVKIWLLVCGGLANFDWQASPRHLIWRSLNWDRRNHKKFLFSYLCMCECRPTCTISARKQLFFFFLAQHMCDPEWFLIYCPYFCAKVYLYSCLNKCAVFVGVCDWSWI